MRIEILLSGGGWYDTTIPSLNAPDGLMMHYTRPFDIAILLVALPLMVFMALNEPLFWAGALVSTLLQVGLCLCHGRLDREAPSRLGRSGLA
jgi:hypothetical protein